MNKLNILVANDDGINERGLHILANALTKYANVYVCAPDSGRSAFSHSIMLLKPITFERVNVINGIECYQTNGTPADCVRLATSLLDVKFDMVFSGINNGLNLGTDILYSGTVAAAREGHIQYIPSIAISVEWNCYDIAENEIEILLDFIFEKKIYSGDYTLNINFPTKEHIKSKGIKFASQGIKRFKTEFEHIEGVEYKEASSLITYDENENTDVYLAKQGYITIVPLKVNQTNTLVLESLKKTYEF